MAKNWSKDTKVMKRKMSIIFARKSLNIEFCFIIFIMYTVQCTQQENVMYIF